MSFSPDDYRIHDAAQLLTPALILYPDFIDHNITVTLDALNGDANRWRPHVKTVKLESVMRRYVERGILQCKCSITAELEAACRAGMQDVLLAYPVTGANARRVLEIADQHPNVRISVLIETLAQARQWAGSRIGIFLDLNSGMNRTGMDPEHIAAVVKLARELPGLALELRGLHFYDGHVRAPSMEERCRTAHDGYNRLLGLIAALDAAGVAVPEVITSGTPAFPCGASYWPFSGGAFLHRVSPGTVALNDLSSLSQLQELDYRPAALVLATVVSHPLPGIVTCDAGHKAVSADEGVPTCAVIGRPDLIPGRPSEEHLPIEVAPGSPVPNIGDHLLLIPRHVCPTVNLFDHAVLVSGGRILGLDRVTARGHESPLLAAASAS
jgi:D-serine deaminase-like pyridoxal phosphate-dependent protein